MKRQRSYFLYCNVITCSSANLAESPRRHGDRSFDSLCAGHHRGTGSHIHPERRLHEGVDNGNNVWGNHRRYDVWCTGRRDLYRNLCGFHPGLTKSNLQSFTLWPVVWFRSRPYIQHHLENGLYDVYYVYIGPG